MLTVPGCLEKSKKKIHAYKSTENLTSSGDTRLFWFSLIFLLPHFFVFPPQLVSWWWINFCRYILCFVLLVGPDCFLTNESSFALRFANRWRFWKTLSIKSPLFIFFVSSNFKLSIRNETKNGNIKKATWIFFSLVLLLLFMNGLRWNDFEIDY